MSRSPRDTELARTFKFVSGAALLAYGVLQAVGFLNQHWITPYVDPGWFLFAFFVGVLLLFTVPAEESVPDVPRLNLAPAVVGLLTAGLLVPRFVHFGVHWGLAVLIGCLAGWLTHRLSMHV